MKKLIVFLFFSASFLNSNEVFCQSYTTESKSCGSCHKPVSNNSTVGMRCPHCGVRWGYENESRTTTTKYKNDYESNYNYTKSSGSTTSKVNLRSSPSTSSSVITVIPAYTFVTIISEEGNWYYVKYRYYTGYSFEEVRGYIFKTLLD